MVVCCMFPVRKRTQWTAAVAVGVSLNMSSITMPNIDQCVLVYSFAVRRIAVALAAMCLVRANGAAQTELVSSHSSQSMRSIHRHIEIIHKFSPILQFDRCVLENSLIALRIRNVCLALRRHRSAGSTEMFTRCVFSSEFSIFQLPTDAATARCLLFQLDYLLRVYSLHSLILCCFCFGCGSVFIVPLLRTTSSLGSLSRIQPLTHQTYTDTYSRRFDAPHKIVT